MLVRDLLKLVTEGDLNLDSPVVMCLRKPATETAGDGDVVFARCVEISSDRFDNIAEFLDESENPDEDADYRDVVDGTSALVLTMQPPTE